MKIVFMGSPDFAVESLHQLIKSGHDILAVVTVPDKPAGRGRKMKSSSVKLAADALNIPLLQPDNLKDISFVTVLQKLAADVFVVVAYRILPSVVFNIPVRGTINVHASLLPKYRGAAPINRAIMNGETETGITIMRIDAQVDTGNILMQQRINIHPEMTAGELHDLLAIKGAELLCKTLDHLDEIKPQKQDESKATKAPKLTKDTAHINFNRSANEVYNMIRGLNPYPAAYCFHDDKLLKLFSAEILPHLSHKQKPGNILVIEKNSFTIACASGAIKILSVQLQGKKQMYVKDFFNGYQIKQGELLK